MHGRMDEGQKVITIAHPEHSSMLRMSQKHFQYQEEFE